jgi:hypothetical protein
MSSTSTDERLRIAFERYRRVMAAHAPSGTGTTPLVSAARLDLTLSLVQAGERLPAAVADQLQLDALALVDATEPLGPAGRPPMSG